MTTHVLAAAPHLFEPIQPPQWMLTFAVSMIAVYFLDKWADKIPGVKGINRLPQTLVLISIATAVSTLLDTKLIGSLSKALVDLSNEINGWASFGWNFGGAVILGIGAFWLAKRYMSDEKIFWNGILFGVGMTAFAVLVPWVATVLEFWRYSVITGISDLFILIVDFITKHGLA
jgi:hypothetical protein